MTTSTTATTPAEDLRPPDRHEWAALAAEEHRRFLDLLRDLDDDEWTRPTDCTAWDVRALAAHVLGSWEGFFGSVRETLHQGRAGKRAAGDGPLVDGITAVQVADRAALSRHELLDRMAAAGPRAARRRARVPGPVRAIPFTEAVGGVPERWRVGYLLGTILTRDTWMHRVDVTRATGRPMELTADHDGRIVADVVAEWARRHGRPCTLRLTGAAGGTFTARGGGGEIELDAVELCRTLSGRAEGHGLLTQEVPF